MANFPFRFLIVEDEANVSLALQEMLGRAYPGVTLLTADNGRDALDLLMQHDIHLIVSDWNMPEMAGDELLVEVRRHPRLRQIPFLMLTARSDKDSVVSAIQAGVNDYICKPFERKSLLEKTQKMLVHSVLAMTGTARAT